MQSPKATRIRQPGCRRCRSHHLKCDRKRPICSTCQKARRSVACTYESRSLRFEHSKYSGLGARSTSPSFDDAAAGSTSLGGARCPSLVADNVIESESIIDRSYPSPYGPSDNNLTLRTGDLAEQGSVHALTNYTRQELQHSTDQIQVYEGNRIRPPSNPASTHIPSPFPRLSTSGAAPSLSLSPSPRQGPRLLTDELECTVFDFYVIHIGDWVSRIVQEIIVDHQLTLKARYWVPKALLPVQSPPISHSRAIAPTCMLGLRISEYVSSGSLRRVRPRTTCWQGFGNTHSLTVIRSSHFNKRGPPCHNRHSPNGRTILRACAGRSKPFEWRRFFVHGRDRLATFRT